MQATRLNSGGQEGGTLTGSWAWRTGTLTVEDTSDHWRRLSSSPVPSGTEEIVVSFAWDEPGLSGTIFDPAANIQLGLYLDDPDGNGNCSNQPTSANPQHVVTDASMDTKKRIALGPDLIADNSTYIGKCVHVLINAPNSDPPGTREGAFAMYRHGGQE